MATAIIILAFIALFIGTVTLIQFPEIATEVYTIAQSAIDIMALLAVILANAIFPTKGC